MTPKIFAITGFFRSQHRGASRNSSRHFTIRPLSRVEDLYSVPSRKVQNRARQSVKGTQNRADKIARLRSAVESGTYCVSAEQIAEKMVHEILADLFT
jgi:anti-sigma28 factor (negative regulator of flagellin synthesis)